MFSDPVGICPERFRHLEDFVLDYDVGIAACAMEEPVSFEEAVEMAIAMASGNRR